MNWIAANDQLIIAAATVALTFVATVQIAREIWRDSRVRRAARQEARGPAWLARRSLEVILADALSETNSPFIWAARSGQKEPLDRLERHMLDTLRLGALAGGADAKAAAAAFDSFLGFADRLNALCGFDFRGRDRLGAMVPSEEDLARASDLFGAASVHAVDAIAALVRLAPRTKHETGVPSLDALPRFTSQSGAITLIGPTAA